MTRRKKDFGLLVHMLSAYITGISAKDLAVTEGITRFKAHEVLNDAIKCMDADLWNLEKNGGVHIAHLRRLRQDEVYWQERVLMWVNALDKHQEYKSAKYFGFGGGCGDCPNKTDGVCCGEVR